MTEHEDGSVTFTAQEVRELNDAYQTLYELLTDQPAAPWDYFPGGQKDGEYKNVVKWAYRLAGDEDEEGNID